MSIQEAHADQAPAPAAPARPAAAGPAGPPARPPARPLLALALMPVIAAFALWAFVWPAVHASPHDLPIGVAGPPAATVQVEARLAAAKGSFQVHEYPDEQAARDAVRQHRIYGAVVAGPSGTTVLTAPAASPVVASLLDQAFGPHPGATAAGKPPATRTEAVVPLPDADPRGAALSSAVLPLVLTGIIGGVLAFFLTRRSAARAGVLLGGAVLTGLVAAALVQGWLGALTGNWAVNASVIGLTVLAVSATLVGLTSLIGPRGIALTAFLMAFLGNPFSGVTSAPELLPQPVGTIGQLLPPGAGGALLRSTAYFGGHQALWHAVVLTAWVVLGFALLALATVRTARRSRHVHRAP